MSKNLLKIACTIVTVFVCLITFSCGKSTNAPVPNLEITPLLQIKDTGKNWEKPYNKGIELHNAKNLMEASYYFSNALGASPGNFKIIQTYYQTMMSLAQTEAADTEYEKYDFAVLQITEGFLQSQIPLVPFEDMEKTLLLLDDVRKKITETQEVPQQDDTESEKQWQIFQANSYVVPEDNNRLFQTIELLDTLKEYAAKKYPDVPTSKLDKALVQTQAALEYFRLSELLEACKNSVKDSIKAVALTVAEYQLQECEQYFRAMVSLRSELPVNHATKMVEEYGQLKKLAEMISETKAAETWKETVAELDQLKNDREKITEAKQKYGKFQLKLENIQQETIKLQNILSSLTGETLNIAITRQTNLSEETIKLVNAQSKAYNSWAMQKIQNCLQKGKEGVGTFANGEKGRKAIGQALIDEIGPIDRRYLTSEVSRCYDEVMGKYLAPNQLNPVKDENSIREEGNIIYTLKEMNEKDKTPLYQF
jgi:hypothetical protein